jgi:hypothetical protein
MIILRINCSFCTISKTKKVVVDDVNDHFSQTTIIHHCSYEYRDLPNDNIQQLLPTKINEDLGGAGALVIYKLVNY